MIGAIGLGSSLGDRRATIELALRRLGAHPEVTLLACSRGYRTPPMRGGTARGWFLNAVARVDTSLSPDELLALCKRLEAHAGRRRARWWGDRTLDLDLLLLGEQTIDRADLRLPHPAIAVRPFVITPLLEVCPDARDPRSGELYRDRACPDGPRAVPVLAFALGRRRIG